jgi:DNA-binding NarL/FixJ family response regulator
VSNRIILILEDEELVADVLQSFLEATIPSPDIKIVIKPTCQEAIEYGLANLADIKAAYLDGNLPDGHGSEVARKLYDAGYRGPIFSISGQPFEDSVPPPERPLYRKYYQKPIHLGTLSHDLLTILLACE